MCSHHLCDTSVPSPKIQEPLSSPARANSEQLLELLRGKHKHRSTAQEPETENTRYEDTLHYLLLGTGFACTTHPLIEVRDTKGLRTVDTKEWYS